jgi:hypothetical protein
MTAVALFDVLAREEGAREPSAATPSPRLAKLAAKLVESALTDLERVREYESQFATPQSADVARSIYELYEAWARDAEQVLARVNAHCGTDVQQSETLADAYCRIRARLGLRPEQIARAREQVRQGLAIPAEELRNELRARHRA